jgi:hypothetical protein
MEGSRPTNSRVCALDARLGGVEDFPAVPGMSSMPDWTIVTRSSPERIISADPIAIGAVPVNCRFGCDPAFRGQATKRDDVVKKKSPAMRGFRGRTSADCSNQ